MSSLRPLLSPTISSNEHKAQAELKVKWQFILKMTLKAFWRTHQLKNAFRLIELLPEGYSKGASKSAIAFSCNLRSSS